MCKTFRKKNNNLSAKDWDLDIRWETKLLFSFSNKSDQRLFSCEKESNKI